MGRRFVLAHGILCGWIVLCASRESRAADAPRAFQMAYDADASCPSEDAFRALVHDKMGDQATSQSASIARVRVRLRAAADAFDGHLELERSDGASYARDLGGPTCADVAPALAFVLALALTGQEKESDFVPPAQPTAAPARASAESPAPPPAPKRALARSGWGFGVGGEAGLRSSLGPRVTALEGAVLEARLTPNTLAPTFRLGFRHAQGTKQISQGSAALSWTVAELEGCPARFRLTSAFELLPCLALNAGVISGSGGLSESAGKARSEANFWLDAGISLRFEAQLLRALSLQLSGDGNYALTDYDFSFAHANTPTFTDIYHVPRISGAALLGLLARFP
jgi:hypothetical protein